MLLKRLAKLGLLLSIKESYLLTKNSLGLVWHPYKTLAVISREKDRSQQLLLLGWPVYVLILGLGFIWTGRRLLATSVEWGWGAKSTLILFLSLTFLVAIYLFFWWVRVWLKK